MPTRKASATWEGGLRGGTGSFRGESGAIDASYSFGSRFTDAGGSNPEELLAAAEAACFSMALAAGLEAAGTPATRVHTDAACTVEKVEDGFKITTMRLTVRAQIPGVDDATFQKAAEDTKKNCVVSKALSSVDIQLQATLES
ncbi:OsmC family peroxiredoxin [Longimicrobium sp.]|uniref:OsmC family peroxiredoxin n=1 Tax=Longimicrobium sp. TaxID=2029185 RepID=UPI003B3AA7BC